MSDSVIRTALRTRLRTVAGLPAMAPENGTYEPVVGTPYVRDHVGFGTRTLRTFPAARGEVGQDGFYQIDLYLLAGAGPGPTDTLVAAIDAAFRPGDAVATTDPARPLILASMLRPVSRTEDGWYRTTLRIGWRWSSANALTLA